MLRLDSGFELDYSNIYNESCIQKKDVNNFERAIQNVWRHTNILRSTGFEAGHVSKDGEPEPILFYQLPYISDQGINTPHMIERLKELGEYGRQHIDTVVSIGIGGSYLGSKVLFDVQCGAFWNSYTDEERKGYPRFYFAGFNVDGLYLDGLIQTLQCQANEKGDDYKVLLVITSKSGSTIEPMANFMVLEKALQERHIAYEVVVVTDTTDINSPTILHKMALDNQWKVFSVPYGVGGRFSVFTEVGFVTAALVGFDIEEFLAGAASMDLACQEEDIFKNPALFSALLKYIASERYGRIIEVFMPYGESLHSLSDWYVQLLSESLGKMSNTCLPYGRTPVAAVGTMDMHAQVQEHQEGRLNKVVQFIKVKEWGSSLMVPNSYSEYPRLDAIGNINICDILNVALDANREALSSDNRFNLTITIPTLNAFHLGEIMFMHCWAVYFESIFAGVDAFDQPGVEVYKRLIGPKLAEAKQ
ncbi:glucose-6-phosphate isomerase [Veillonella caviae]|uniref:glucose-6-phosphate isomerase n=1 Tax=Veillonella caviae TaxID=248316 RepID=UPI002356C5DD|nr:glucose-6-phosphate isomerase [Veillonella caviae]